MRTCDFHLLVMPRFGTKCQGVFELSNNSINREIPGRFLTKTRDDFNNNFKLLSLRASTQGQAIFELVFCILVLSTSIVSAECVPTPDCSEIGYTATSCEGGFVRCPFDISKLFCVPCDSSYRYTCSDSGQVGSGESCDGKYIECACSSSYKYTCLGTGYSGGRGSACGGKYSECTCSSGYEWSGSACEESCTSSSSDYCWVHDTCHGDCCSDGSIASCDPQCGGSGCYVPEYDFDCPELVCDSIGGEWIVYSIYYENQEGCSVSCSSRKCSDCACEAGGGYKINGYCTSFCDNVGCGLD